MESAIFGLIGVALGAALSAAREWWLQSRKIRKDAVYLCALVSCALDQFTEQCAEVVADDGLSEGQADEHGYHRIRASEPTLEFDALKVDWKSLPPKLMHKVLDLPNYAREAARGASAAFEYSSPPDFTEGFEERQLIYATLGLAASSLAERLREYAGLSVPERPQRHWDPITFMTDRKKEIDGIRTRRGHTSWLPELVEQSRCQPADTKSA